MLNPSTVNRVPFNTSPEVNRAIRRRTEDDIERYARAGRSAIARRLRALDAEWDIERTLEVNASTVILAGLTLGFAFNRRWFAFPVAVAGFLLLHGVQGWCPPVPILRRRGVRTSREIDHERVALKALRGDFRSLNANDADPREALAAAEK